MNPKDSEEVEQIRYCKKCGCELASTNRRKLCENCRRKRNAKIREWGTAAGASIGAVLLVAPTILGILRGNVDTTNDDEKNEEDEDYEDYEEDNDNTSYDESDTL